MMAHLIQAKVMRTKLEQKSQINIILESLPDSFSLFKMNYNINKLDLTPVELMHEFLSAKESMKSGSVHFTQYYVKSKSLPKDGNKNKSKKKKMVVVLVTKTTAMKKPKAIALRMKRRVTGRLLISQVWVI